MRAARVSLLASIAVLASAVAIAQEPPAGAPPAEPDSIQGVKLKGKAPVNPETLRVSLPAPKEARLANGLRVVLLEDPKLPTFWLHLVISGGGLADPADKRGLAMATAAVLREGTEKRSSREIAEGLATLGATLASGATPSSGESTVSVSGLTDHLDAVLALFADVVRTPAFPQAELDKFKSRLLAQLEYQRTRPGFLAQEQFMRAVYGEHPASHVVPQERVLRELSREDLAAYHAAYYKPNNAILIAYGDLTLESLVAKLERAFGSWAAGEVKLPELSSPATPEKARVVLIDRPASVQTSLWLGSLGIDRRSEDYFPMLVMNHVLGGGPASRLFVNLREDKGYTYGVYSSFTGTKFPGVVVATTDVRTAVTEGAMKELTGELERISSEPVPKQELENAKRALIGRFALSLETPQALMANLVAQKIYGLPDDYWEKYPERVEAVTAADVRRVAARYYAADRLQIVAVGDSAAVRKTLEKYADVEEPAAQSEPAPAAPSE